jgi:hypothetical protein
MARATETEHKQRIDQIAHAINVRDAQRSELIAWAKPRWHINDRQIDYDIAAARARIAQSSHVDLEFENGQSLRRHTLVFVQAYKDGKLAVASKALHEIDVLRGLGARGEQTQQIDIATIRKNLKEIGAELFENGGLDGLS